MPKKGIFLIFVIALAIVLLHCKKNTQGLTVTLYDKPLSVIQSHIIGKWSLRYMHGEFCQLQTIHLSDVNWVFGTGDRVTEIYQGSTTAATVINWVRDGDSLYTVIHLH